MGLVWGWSSPIVICVDISELQTYWDSKVGQFLDGHDYMDSQLRSWKGAYSGQGRGQVEMSAFPEPYVGSIQNT